VAALVEDLGDRGFDATAVRPTVRLHNLTGVNVWSVSFASQYRQCSAPANNSYRATPQRVGVHRLPRRIRARILTASSAPLSLAHLKTFSTSVR
jgi:hypothetical protein